MFNSLANILAMSPQGQQGGAGSLISMLVMFGAVILIMYFLMIRPQQKRQKEHQKMLDNLKKGDKVVTTAGIHGTITDIDGSSMILQVSDNVKITFEKTAIAAKK
ncbi:MAG: preprotein translocase subunit YajC [Bacteroidetes bacterium]|nr:MAG: preprotein translocase subunit YajC [Bacteroidota bacterium]